MMRLLAVVVLLLGAGGAAAHDCLAFFDQGGGSYTAELYSAPDLVEAKIKSKKLLKNPDAPHGETMTSMPPKWLNEQNGTFEGDYVKSRPATLRVSPGSLHSTTLKPSRRWRKKAHCAEEKSARS